MTAATSLLYAGALALLALALKMNVIRLRVQRKIDLGAGGSMEMQQAVRAHGNLIENVPLALLVIALLEMQGAAPSWAIHVFGIALLSARVIHAAGLLSTPGPSAGRFVGTVVTNAVLLGGGALALWRTGAG